MKCYDYKYQLLDIMITELSISLVFQRHKIQEKSNCLCNKRSPLPAEPPGLEGQLVGLSLTPLSLYQPQVSLAALCCCSGPRSKVPERPVSLAGTLHVPRRRTQKLTSLSPPPARQVALALAPPRKSG